MVKNKCGFPRPPPKAIVKNGFMPVIRSGGGKNSLAAYNGPCCGGTRKVGDFKPYTCTKTGIKVYCCGKCKLPLALNPEQRARIQKNKEAAFEKALMREVEAVEKAYLKRLDEEDVPVWLLPVVRP